MTDRQIAFFETRVDRLVDYMPHFFYPESVPLDIEGMTSEEPIPFAELPCCEFRTMSEGELWGRDWSSAWFRLRGAVPEEWQGRTVVARLQFQGEACVFSADGVPLQGLTNGSIYAPTLRERFPVAAPATGGEAVELLVEAAANGLGGIARDNHPIPGKAYHEGHQARVEFARLAVFDEEAWQCWLDASYLSALMRSLPKRDPHRARLLHVLTEATNAFRYDDHNCGEIREILAPCFDATPSSTTLSTTAVGHAHIDTAWLWPMRETIRKCARTFSSQLALSERYPGYVFGASQPAHYQFVKQHYPELFERIRQAIAEGRWECQGAMWVEADTNVPSGESLARQLLYGKRFFMDEFGVEVRNLWIPDVFGYSASLPQLLLHAGVEVFLTQKISWSQFSRFPHHTFRWRGIDGTEVVTHFPPEDSYNSALMPSRLRHAQENFEERAFLPEFLTLFGIGDGGGGPTEEFIERGRRSECMADVPRLSFGPAQPLLDRLNERADDLQVWSGELYLELHRGTLTTQARNKKLNRQCELALRRAEMLAACLPLAEYPRETFRDLWRTVLTNQFHDIIPGSSIARVYEDSRREYQEVLDRAAVLVADTAGGLSSADQESAVTLFNATSHHFNGAVYLPDVSTEAALSEDDDHLIIQEAVDGGVWVSAEIDPLSTCVVRPIAGAELDAPSLRVLEASETVLANSFVRYEFGDNGFLCRVTRSDFSEEEEFMCPGERGNVLSLYEDWPHNWDAWDVDMTYEQQHREDARLVSRQVLECGPLVAALKYEWAIGQSTITQTIRLTAHSARLDFATRVDWRECRKMLRVAFPVDVQADNATFEIQFGTYQRPTHRNTEWDMARFEVCGHRFADLSDKLRGVALLNNCKYGYKVHERTLDLNLLRATFHPDPTADRCVHELTYSLLPHSEPFEDSEVIEEAHFLNQPPIVLSGGIDMELPCRNVDGCVLIDAVKKSETEDAWVVRLYEPLGASAECHLVVRDAGARVYEADLLERRGAEIPLVDGGASIPFRAFEVKTLVMTG